VGALQDMLGRVHERRFEEIVEGGIGRHRREFFLRFRRCAERTMRPRLRGTSEFRFALRPRDRGNFFRLRFCPTQDTVFRGGLMGLCAIPGVGFASESIRLARFRAAESCRECFLSISIGTS